VRTWAQETRATAARLDAEQAAREAPYRTARYQRWRWPIALTFLALAGGLAFTPMDWRWQLGLWLAAFAWGIAAGTWAVSGVGKE
jgi:hypothetical protein